MPVTMVLPIRLLVVAQKAFISMTWFYFWFHSRFDIMNFTSITILQLVDALGIVPGVFMDKQHSCKLVI